VSEQDFFIKQRTSVKSAGSVKNLGKPHSVHVNSSVEETEVPYRGQTFSG
jgi:hypothetical protein